MYFCTYPKNNACQFRSVHVGKNFPSAIAKPIFSCFSCALVFLLTRRLKNTIFEPIRKNDFGPLTRSLTPIFLVKNFLVSLAKARISKVLTQAEKYLSDNFLDPCLGSVIWEGCFLSLTV